MWRRLWLAFAQAVTVGAGLLLAVQVLQPQWLHRAAAPAATSAAPLAADIATARGAAAAAAVGAVAVPAPAPAPASYAEAARRAMPAVVNVYTTKEFAHPALDEPLGPFSRQMLREHRPTELQRVTSLGSGVIVSSEGYVVTNNHVVEGADSINIALGDGRRIDARLVGADPETDLAVLKIDLADLPAIRIGHSEQLRVGDVVLAIGNPFEVGQTVTMGIVSALGRANPSINMYVDFIQTDAAINRGNSGGALVDADGALIGINTAILSSGDGGSLGIGFAIPTSAINEVMPQLIREGRVRRGYFGIEPYDITPEIAAARSLEPSHGVVVNSVVRDAPAGRAGMRPDDVLLAINGAPVTASRAVLAQIARLPPGSTARVTVLRQGRQMELRVEVGERPPPESR